MRYKMQFRILCKAIGVYFFVLGCAGLVSVEAGHLAVASRLAREPSVGWTVQEGLLFAAAPVFELAAGLYLLFGGRWIADLAVPSNREIVKGSQGDPGTGATVR